MFTSKGLFSEIECPYYKDCKLPKCLFAHSMAETAVQALPVATQVLENVRLEAEIFDEGDRKRRKFESDESIKLPVKIAQAAIKDRPESGTGLFSSQRHVSPPPLRRSIRDDSQGLAHAKPGPEKSRSSSQTTTKPLKTEALNPRMLKHSPASHEIRYRLLKALHSHLVRLNSELSKDADASEEALVLSDQQLITMTLDIEERAAIDKPSIYSNVVKNSILSYKRMSVADWKARRQKEHEASEALKELAAADRLVPVALEAPKPIITGLSEDEELTLLPKLYTPVEGLEKHGYVTKVPSDEAISGAKLGVEAANGWEVCDRCKARFQVFPGRREEDGALTSGGPCIYHWGKPFWQEKSADDPKAKREKKYRCCGESMADSRGCTQSENHVFKVSEVKRLAAILNFEETPQNDAHLTRPVCIDGEMGYTVHGLELIRLTATAWPRGEELFDVLVRPVGEILDLNSRFSGVWPQHLTDAPPWSSTPDTENAPTGESSVHRNLAIVSSPAVARSLLFEHLSPQTPLIGHGLENDLNAVRLIHPTIIDTALLFPHKMGLPYRHGLKMLVHMYLGRHIQVVVDGKMTGHDSKEDANAAGDLVRWAIGREWEKMQGDGWKLKEGKFVPPPLKNAAGGKLTVEYLEREQEIAVQKGLGTKEVKCGSKRSIIDISGDDVEEGEVAEG